MCETKQKERKKNRKDTRTREKKKEGNGMRKERRKEEGSCIPQCTVTTPAQHLTVSPIHN
jgi:hypothetical protein